MANKKPKIETATKNEAGYHVFDAQSKGEMQAYGEVIDSFDSSQGSLYNLSQEVVTDVYVREGFGQSDRSAFRNKDRLPQKFKDIISSCRCTYKKIGVVRQVIDLMTDFACEDLTFIHTDRKVQDFYRSWQNKIRLNGYVQEFARHCLIDANVITKRVTAKLTVPAEREFLERNATGEADLKVLKEGRRVETREIPWRYHFLDISKLNWALEDVGLISGERQLVFCIPRELQKIFKTAKDGSLEKKIVDGLPMDLKDALKENLSKVTLDMDKIFVTHFRKDDWEHWATPFLYAVLSDIVFKEKLRQAEIAALDGTINVVRLWKLGDHKEGFLPNAAAVNKLSNILQSNTGGGTMDIVWDSLIEMEDFYPPIGDILGSEKYEQVNRDILIGLGIPEILLGGKGSNFSNSFIQLKTLVERLESLRERMLEWLNHEASLIAEAMGFESLPMIKFNDMSLKDDAVEKRLIMGLLDRGVISPEGVLEVYDKDFDIEIERIKQQKKLFKENNLEVLTPYKSENAGQPGRPGATKDVSTRKTRQANPRTTAELLDTANKFMGVFDEEIVPIFVESKGAKNLRQLTAEQKEELNGIRLFVLSCIDMDDEPCEDTVLGYISTSRGDAGAVSFIQSEISSFTERNHKEPTTAQKRTIETMAWAKYYGGI